MESGNICMGAETEMSLNWPPVDITGGKPADVGAGATGTPMSGKSNPCGPTGPKEGLSKGVESPEVGALL